MFIDHNEPSGILENGAPRATAANVAELRELLGNNAVLLPIKSGEKAPRIKAWQETTSDAMADPDYLKQLERGNIGVLQGAPSDGLCSIDIDSDDAAKAFLELNPQLRQTLHSRGARGMNIWVRVTGEYPALTKIKFRDGREFGEWRSTKGQTVIHGKHPSGCDYRITNRVAPVEIPFDSIVWPDGLVLPWDTSVYEELVKLHGPPYFATERALKLNHYFLAAKFATEHLVVYEPEEGQFYQYNAERGLWQPATDASIKDQFARDLKDYADTQGEQHRIISQRKDSLLNGLTAMLKGHVEKRAVFTKRPAVIHVGNGMLHLDLNPVELREFSPQYYSRNQCPIPFVEGADCPRFKKELLAAALDPDDVSLIQRWAGSLLLGGNAAQRLMLLTGRAGGGKSTLIEIVETIIGPENVVELRTEQLGDRFELGRYLAKMLLTGKDVPADFLMRKAASNIKKLVGHDLISVELKHSNGCFNMRGEFAVVVTCNSRLRVLLEGDADAWRRRLMLIEYNKPKPKRRIANFAEKLVADEGPGILNWMLKGASEHLQELQAGGDFVLTKAQNDRVELLLAESDSIREFVRSCLQPAAPREQVTVEELLKGYEVFCGEMGYTPMVRNRVASEMPDLIAEIHHVHKRHDLQTDEGTRRGFTGLKMAWRDQ